MDYHRLRRHVESLPWVALLTTGRSGSHFLQSLLDGHPELFVFCSHLLFHDFWRASFCVAAGPPLDLDDLVTEFSGKFLPRLKSRYDLEDNTRCLGENRDRAFHIDPQEFRSHLKGVHGDGPITARSFLRSVYVAWALSLGQDPFTRRVFIDHMHHIWNLPDYLRDFPDCRLLGVTRDPRATWVSGVEHWISHRPPSAWPWLVHFTIDRVAADYSALLQFPNEFRVVRLEDLGSRPVLAQLCAWLGIRYHDSLERSTFAGLRWWGDRHTVARPSPGELGFAPRVTRNGWRCRLGWAEKFWLDYVLRARLDHYEYPRRRSMPGEALLAALLIPLPCRLEWRHGFRSARLQRTPKGLCRPLFYYLKRVALGYRLWGRALRREPFRLPWLRPDGAPSSPPARTSPETRATCW